MNYEEKIKELTERIEKLEKAENKRILKRNIKIALKIIEITIIIVIILTVYYKINNTLIKPYKNKVDYIEEKVNTVEKFVKDKWNAIQKYNPFSNQ